MRKYITTIPIIIICILTFAVFDYTQAEERRGVMGCNAAGFGSVGARLPSGAHVPVWDYAVSKNTNILIYKECILDGVQNTLTHAGIAQMTRNGLKTINEGPDGNPMFVTHIPTHYENILDPKAEQIYSGIETDNLCAPFKQNIKTSLRKSYEQRKNKPHESYSCSVESSKVEACLNNDLVGCGGLQGFYDLVSNPANNPLFAYYDAQQYFDSTLRSEAEREKMKLDWGNGFRSATKEQTITLDDGSTVTINRIVTPGYLIAEYASLLLGTGLRQMENADEIDEIIGLSFSNLGTHMLSTNKGLAGIEPYLDIIVDEAISTGQGKLITLTLDSLSAAIVNEMTILDSLESIASAIVTTKNSIRNIELQCLDKVVARAEQSTWYDFCVSSTGTTTDCTIAKAREYDYGSVETFESSMQRVSMSGYGREAGTISTQYSGGGATAGSANTTAGGTYYKYTSSGQDVSSLANITITPYANEAAYRTLGDFRFSKETVNNEAVYRFSYDLPDVTVTATSPTTTTSVSKVVLDLKKNHSELVIENNNNTKYNTVKTLYGHIGDIKAVIQDLQTAKTNLQNNPSGAAVNAAEAVLDKARGDQAAFIFAQDMNGNLSAVAALPSETISCWTDSDGSGCGSPRWCTDASIKANWSNYIR